MEGIRIDTCGGNCPFQITGWVDDHPFYLRARGRIVSVSISHKKDLSPLDFPYPHDDDTFHHYVEYGVGLYDAGWIEKNKALSILEDAVKIFRENIKRLI